MQALWIENQRLSLRDDLDVTPGTGQVAVSISLAGICGTDLELLRGYYDFVGVPGHEFVGKVTTPGDWLGKRVVADINFACGLCEPCLDGDPHHCLDRSTLGIRQASGAFAHEIVVPTSNLIEVPANVPDSHAVFAEPLAAALQILTQIDLKNQSVLLVGAGRLGRMIAWVVHCLIPTAKLEICVRDQKRKSQLPDTASLRKPTDLACHYDVAIDCTGHPAGFEIALAALKAKGTLVVKSTYANTLNINMSRIVVDEISILGSRCGPMDQAVQFLTDYPEVFSALNNEVYPLHEYAMAFERALDPLVDKVLLQP